MILEESGETREEIKLCELVEESGLLLWWHSSSSSGGGVERETNLCDGEGMCIVKRKRNKRERERLDNGDDGEWDDAKER